MKTEQAAERLLVECKVKRVPIPVDKIAKHLGAKITYEPFDGDDCMSGVLIREKEKVVIGINSSHGVTRQRFTIAHEIGHLVLKHKGDIFVDKTVRSYRDSKSSLAIDKNEIEANGFAAALLMPRGFLMEELDKIPANKRGMNIAEHLASVFEVSSQAMEYRLSNLGITIPG